MGNCLALMTMPRSRRPGSRAPRSSAAQPPSSTSPAPGSSPPLGPGPPGGYRFIRETTGPAVPASALGNNDIILLSHDRHRSSTELGTFSGAQGKTAVRGTAPTESETR